jgi:hypothetical protein
MGCIAIEDSSGGYNIISSSRTSSCKTEEEKSSVSAVFPVDRVYNVSWCHQSLFILSCANSTQMLFLD